MAELSRHDAWQAGDRYEAYMGRWSRQLAPRFLDWLGAPPNLNWLDVGCGTGALSAAILARCNPASLIGVDPSEGFVATARALLPDRRAEFRVGDAQALPLDTASRDMVASGLVLNFVPDKQKALARDEADGARPAGWSASMSGTIPASASSSCARSGRPPRLSIRQRGILPRTGAFRFARPMGLTELVKAAGLDAHRVHGDRGCRPCSVTSRTIWHPFTLGAGPAPGYCVSLEPEARQRLKERLEHSLPRQADGSIPLKARAWALKAFS